ncbi:RNase H domain-containing protein [Trichonephila clavipes]|uniref:RNase H domain-containing protein n=1 Tax=Trichonephila clavipes TaxID=2585209 RepID=A0A8X6WI17_TRICX|nr:RNase H domain-containing protein [Trichonephila clavipes]
MKSISKEQPQVEKCNMIQDVNGAIPQTDKQAADIIGEHYQKISNLNFSKEDGFVKRRASNIVHGCSINTYHQNYLFAKDFSIEEFEAALCDTDLRKSPGPDGIHGSMIDHLGKIF